MAAFLPPGRFRGDGPEAGVFLQKAHGSISKIFMVAFGNAPSQHALKIFPIPGTFRPRDQVECLIAPDSISAIFAATNLHFLRLPPLARGFLSPPMPETEIKNPEQSREDLLRLDHLKAALDQHAIVARTDVHGRITFVNDKFCEISGYSREELLGRTHKVVNSGRHPAGFFRDLWKTISAGRVWKGEIENRAKDGSHYFVATTIVPELDGDGKPAAYLAIRTDVTAQKLAAERLRVLTRELEAKNRDLETLISAASHDLRSPLVNVQGFSAMVGEQAETVRDLLQAAAGGSPPSRETVDAITGEMTDAVRFICAGAEKMDALLKGLLVFSRMGRTAPLLQPVDADKLVRGSLAATRFQIESSGATVSLEPLPPCLADAGLLGQAVSNLIDNAIKYRNPGRTLELGITASAEGGRCVYRFSDNGIGIAPEHREKVFELFHRLDPRRGEGHGLGLAIVRRAMDRMGGTITVEQSPEGGTVFAMSLAAVPENHTAPAADGHEHQPA
jgi:chemotaxis family two-component system sensor kinase Cph1